MVAALAVVVVPGGGAGGAVGVARGVDVDVIAVIAIVLRPVVGVVGTAVPLIIIAAATAAAAARVSIGSAGAVMGVAIPLVPQSVSKDEAHLLEIVAPPVPSGAEHVRTQRGDVVAGH